MILTTVVLCGLTAVAVWVVLTLQRIHSSQTTMQDKLTAIEQMLQRR